MPTVSVIIPNFNHAPYLHERIDSVLNQTYRDFEVIILDDCSTDNSREIIETYRGHEKITHIENNSVNSGSTFKQWKKGLDLAKGEWIWIAESDDVADENFLNELIEIAKTKGSDIVFCNSTIINNNSEQCFLYGYSNMPSKQHYTFFNNNFSSCTITFLNQWMLKDNFIPNASAVVFSKNAIGKINSNVFSNISEMKLMGDWLFWIEILLKTTQISFSSKSLNQFRTHSANVRETKYKERIIEMFMIASYFNQYPLITKAVYDGLLFRYIHKSKEIKLNTCDHLLILKEIVRNNLTFRFIKSLIILNK